MSDGENDGQRLVAALTAAGFTVAGHGRGYIRMARPGPRAGGWLPVPTDPTAPEYGEGLGKVLGVLEAEVRQGEAARQVLGLYRMEGTHD